MTAITYVLSFGFVLAAVGLNYVQALTDADLSFIQETVTPVLSECAAERDIPPQEINKDGKYDDIHPCITACVFRKAQIINEKGMYDPKEAEAKGKDYFKSEEDVTTFKSILTTCASVNEKEVSDGEEGCDRAHLLLKCFLENHNQLLA